LQSPPNFDVCKNEWSNRRTGLPSLSNGLEMDIQYLPLTSISLLSPMFILERLPLSSTTPPLIFLHLHHNVAKSAKVASAL
jgi:hypothetical protein